MTKAVDISEDVVVSRTMPKVWTWQADLPTDRVLRATVNNTPHGLDIIILSMDHEIKIRITEDIVQYAVDEDIASDAMLAYLLNQHGSRISVIMCTKNTGRLLPCATPVEPAIQILCGDSWRKGLIPTILITWDGHHSFRPSKGEV